MTMTELPLWTQETVTAAIDTQADQPFAATGVSIDSRAVSLGDLFIALKGPRFNGNDFVNDAFKKGAVAAIVQAPFGESPRNGIVIEVEDTMKALRDLAIVARMRSRARIIAVTGSVGKTSTKEMIKLALSQSGKTFASAGNLNNDIGLPLSLARLPDDAVYAVFELGMNHPGELAPLSNLLRPHLAVITTVESVHIEYFASEEAIADEKAEVMTGLEPGGSVVLNHDNRHYTRLLGAAKGFGVEHILDFGGHPDATVRLIDCSLHGNSSAVLASIADDRIEYGLAAPGRHWISNSLAALAAVKGIGGDVNLAAAALAKLEAPKGRGQHRQVSLPMFGAGASFTLIDESYNASPASVKAALAVLERTPGGRRIAVLGDMLELGAASEAAHIDLVKSIAGHAIDTVFTCGPFMAKLQEALPPAQRGGHAPTSKALAPLVTAALRPSDIVTVKGSLGSGMAVIIEAIERLSAVAPSRAANGH